MFTCSARARRCRAHYDVLFIPQIATHFFCRISMLFVVVVVVVVVVVAVVVVAAVVVLVLVLVLVVHATHLIVAFLWTLKIVT